MAEKIDTMKYEAQLCFPLYACSKEMVKKYKPYLDEIDLTYTQYIAMSVLWEEKEISVKLLGEKLLLDSGTLTPVLKTLEKKGYVSRARSKQDERILIVTATEKGMEIQKAGKDIPEKVERNLDLTDDEMEVMNKLLYKLMGTFI